MNPIDENPRPQGELALQTVAMPKDTNANGDIFGGWLLSQMDIAGGVGGRFDIAERVAHCAQRADLCHHVRVALGARPAGVGQLAVEVCAGDEMLVVVHDSDPVGGGSSVGRPGG